MPQRLYSWSQGGKRNKNKKLQLWLLRRRPTNQTPQDQTREHQHYTGVAKHSNLGQQQRQLARDWVLWWHPWPVTAKWLASLEPLLLSAMQQFKTVYRKRWKITQGEVNHPTPPSHCTPAPPHQPTHTYWSAGVGWSLASSAFPKKANAMNTQPLLVNTMEQ